MSCEHDCTRAPPFPRRIANRPALDTIDYRIGDYRSMLADMIASIDAAPALAEWTHREPDDPGIALLQSAAIVGDILAFYQHVYANEAFLRTAKWRESVADLVRVLGYRLAPGLGGRARFAIAVKGARPVRIPAGFAISVQLPDGPKPSMFETSAPLDAVADLSRFHFYRPHHLPRIDNGADTFQLDGDVPPLAPGDRLVAGVAGGRVLSQAQVLVVDAAWESFGVRHVRTRGRIASLGASVGALRAFKIDASARHFGHDAPPTQVTIGDGGHGTQRDIAFNRDLRGSQPAPARPAIGERELPLDGAPAEFVAGSHVLVEAQWRRSAGPGPRQRRIIEREIVRVEPASRAWGALQADGIDLLLDQDLVLREGSAAFGVVDVREVTAHHVTGRGWRLRAAPVPTDAADGTTLDFFGTREAAAALQGRTVLLALPSGPVAANVLNVPLGLPGTQPRFFRVSLDRRVSYTPFPRENPKVHVHGNLVEATEGKSEAQAAIGDGDARAALQTFALSKAPLTYLLDTGSSPPQVPQLEVWVDRVRWERVDSFYGRGANEQVYVVREGADGGSFVQFGDGRNGARLPSGRGNVVARYRTGSGAHGMPAPGQKADAQRKVPGFDEASLLEAVTGGAAPQGAADARAAAPAAMQSLGRIVSVSDYEAEALAIPGVLKARAEWAQLDGTSLVTVTVLCSSATAADQAALDAALRRALARRGPSRTALRVVFGERRAVSLRLAVTHDGWRREEDIALDVAAALGVEDEDGADDLDPGRRGLLHWRMRTFGEGVHGSQILGAVQNVHGVSWVDLTSLQLHIAPIVARLPLLAVAAGARVPAERWNLRATPRQLLSLPRAGLHLDLAVDAATREAT